MNMINVLNFRWQRRKKGACVLAYDFSYPLNLDIIVSSYDQLLNTTVNRRGLFFKGIQSQKEARWQNLCFKADEIV